MLRNLPVAKFYYRGHHSHPVKRTVLLIENKPNHLVGYELREGSEIRPFKKAPIKSYRKDKIARYKNCRNHNKITDNLLLKSTLKRLNLSNLVLDGI